MVVSSTSEISRLIRLVTIFIIVQELGSLDPNISIRNFMRTAQHLNTSETNFQPNVFKSWSLRHCGIQCAKEATCRSFYYVKMVNRCYTYSQDAGDLMSETLLESEGFVYTRNAGEASTPATTTPEATTSEDTSTSPSPTTVTTTSVTTAAVAACSDDGDSQGCNAGEASTPATTTPEATTSEDTSTSPSTTTVTTTSVTTAAVAACSDDGDSQGCE